jgi:ubiquinone biosynthesis protein
VPRRAASLTRINTRRAEAADDRRHWDARSRPAVLWESITTARDVGRVHEIAKVLVRFGFADVLARLGLASALERAGHLLHVPRLEAEAALPSPVRLRHSLEALGPTFVKLGQVLASRVDLFGPEWIAQFEQLQNHAPFVPFDIIEAQLEAELGAPLDEVFGQVERAPLAAASIAQVHRVRLRDGTEAVVKVRRPGVRETIAADIRLLERLARILEARSPEAARYRPREVVRHFRASIERELDLAAECHNAERIAVSLAAMPGVVIPRVHWQWTSEAINVQDFVPGRPLQDLLEPGADAAAGANLPAIAQAGAQAVLQMVFVEGFFHADPHGGNVLYLPGDRLGLIDFGMVGHLSTPRRRQLVELLRGLVERDAGHVADVLEEWTEGGFADPDAVLDDIEMFLDRYHGVPLGQLHLGEMLMQVTDIVRAHGLWLPPDLAMVVKVFITLEGLGRKLDPAFDMVGAATPFLHRVLRERYQPRALARRLSQGMVEVAEALALLPRQLRGLVHSAAEGRLRLRVDSEQLSAVANQVSHAANRLAMGLVIAALIIGSSIVMTVEGGPTMFGLPFFGLAGFLGAIAGGAWLLLSILRSGGGR